MKRVDELGISSWPWHTFHDNWVESADDNPAMSTAAYAGNQNDARLIAAAPEMYQLMLEAIPWLADISAEVVGNECARQIDDLVSRIKATLAKAGGEEEKK